MQTLLDFFGSFLRSLCSQSQENAELDTNLESPRIATGTTPQRASRSGQLSQSERRASASGWSAEDSPSSASTCRVQDNHPLKKVFRSGKDLKAMVGRAVSLSLSLSLSKF